MNDNHKYGQYIFILSNINMDSTLEGSMNDNIDMDSTIAAIELTIYNMDSTIAGSINDPAICTGQYIYSLTLNCTIHKYIDSTIAGSMNDNINMDSTTLQVLSMNDNILIQ